MILPELQLTSLANQRFKFSGLDSLDYCLDKDYFVQYPHDIDYCYNSRGFRDSEWPNEDLNNAIWCFGDSFSVGLGSPINHIWTQRLSRASQQRTVNVSMDGASNNWIARRCCDVYKSVRPKNIVVMWSYLHRRESLRHTEDLDRRLHVTRTTTAQDYANFKHCRDTIKNFCQHTNIIEFIIPGWEPGLTQISWSKIRDPSWPELVENLKIDNTDILQELGQIHGVNLSALSEQLVLQKQLAILENLTQVPQLDRARDGHHFDLVTSDWVVDRILPQLI